MNRKCIKITVLWITIVSMMLSVCSVFAFAETQQQQQTKTEDLQQNIETLIKRLAITARYDEVTSEALYKRAFQTVFEENPEMYENVLKALLSSIDEHSVYYNEEEGKEFLADLNEEVTGIGVSVLTGDGSIIVSRTMPGSPAEKAGIRSGDIIVSSDGYDLRSMDYDSAISKIRGIEGTTAKIGILRAGIDEPVYFEIKREKITQNPVEYEVIETETKKIAKITIYSFTEISAESFKAALSQADKDGISKIIIDLRNNGGGYLEQAVEIADMFLPKDSIITTEDYKIQILNKVFTASGQAKKKYKVAILVNGRSASASEVLTAALSENGVANVVGEKTFGKGTVQTMNYTDDGGMLKYTVAYYLTPNGENINEVGIIPDCVVENTLKPFDISKFDAFALNKTYKVGDSGAEVKLAKEMLSELGVFVGEINENYDENLKIAVTVFQKAKELFPYGVLDITTQLNLYDTLKTLQVENDDQLEAAIDIL